MLLSGHTGSGAGQDNLSVTPHDAARILADYVRGSLRFPENKLPPEGEGKILNGKSEGKAEESRGSAAFGADAAQGQAQAREAEGEEGVGGGLGNGRSLQRVARIDG
jgi:hypothetical protein